MFVSSVLMSIAALTASRITELLHESSSAGVGGKCSCNRLRWSTSLRQGGNRSTRQVCRILASPSSSLTVVPCSLEQAQLAFRVALCDSFDTVKGLSILLSTVSTANVYSNRGRSQVNISALVAVEQWVTRMLRMLGLGEGSPTDSNGERKIGWGLAPVAGQTDAVDVSARESTFELLLTHVVPTARNFVVAVSARTVELP